MQSTDLAALARKEKERRAKVAKPAKVLTEEELKEAAAKETGAVTTVTPVTGGSSGAPAAAEVDESGREFWKGRMEAARKGVTEAQAKLADMQAELERFRSDLTVVPADEAQDPLRLQKRAAKIGEMTRAVEAQRAAVDAAKRAVAELEEQARREGVPAGWLR